MANTHCPLCGKENKCMVDATEPNGCWCTMEKFPKGIFELVPVESRRKHCICHNCLAKYKEEMQKI
ncbi:cysteine-rich CWC family protein [Psychrobacillus soli]|uniref:Cysteine-rich CWC family protein n=1 Tax=Psychrobacillus soli TaxID=1543965 RepID=A0A544TD93_9BACI|nr:cysteine-rich CWC family protein [Psychrobacillus soli]TQR15422.1 cysteine-rich CWC family protein [Psychrobacillus soli]